MCPQRLKFIYNKKNIFNMFDSYMKNINNFNIVPTYMLNFFCIKDIMIFLN